MSKLFSFRTLATLVLVGTTSACSTMNPAGLIAASRLDPLNTPPSEIAVAVGVPQTLRLSNGDAEFRLSFQSDTAASTILLEETAPLQLVLSGEAGPRPSTADEIVYVARIAAADAPRIAALQNEIRTLRAAGTEGEGSLTVRVVGGCFVGPSPSDIAVSIWLQTDASDGFVQVARQQDISRAFGTRDAAMLRAQLSPCAE